MGLYYRYSKITLSESMDHHRIFGARTPAVPAVATRTPSLAPQESRVRRWYTQQIMDMYQTYRTPNTERNVSDIQTGTEIVVREEKCMIPGGPGERAAGEDRSPRTIRGAAAPSGGSRQSRRGRARCASSRPETTTGRLGSCPAAPRISGQGCRGHRSRSGQERGGHRPRPGR